MIPTGKDISKDLKEVIVAAHQPWNVYKAIYKEIKITSGNIQVNY